MSDPTAPAGWYPDVHRPGFQRYWDGTAWTDHVHPDPAAAMAPSVAAPAPGAPRPPRSGRRLAIGLSLGGVALVAIIVAAVVIVGNLVRDAERRAAQRAFCAGYYADSWVLDDAVHARDEADAFVDRVVTERLLSSSEQDATASRLESVASRLDLLLLMSDREDVPMHGDLEDVRDEFVGDAATIRGFAVGDTTMSISIAWDTAFRTSSAMIDALDERVMALCAGS